jgi:hypothetical protein
VLKEGKLVEEGTPEELIEKKGLYSKLYHIQQKSLGWRVLNNISANLIGHQYSVKTSR